MPRHKAGYLAKSQINPDLRGIHEPERPTAEHLLLVVGLHKSPADIRRETDESIKAFRTKLRRSTGIRPTGTDEAITDEELEQRFTKGMRQLAIRLVGETSMLASSRQLLGKTKQRLDEQLNIAQGYLGKRLKREDEALKSAEKVDYRIRAARVPLDDVISLSETMLQLLKTAIVSAARQFDVRSPERFSRFQSYLKEIVEIALSPEIEWSYSREVEELPLIKQKLEELIARLTHLNQKLSSDQ